MSMGEDLQDVEDVTRVETDLEVRARVLDFEVLARLPEVRVVGADLEAPR